MPIFPNQKSKSLGDTRKWHFGKHDKSLTGLWGPSYWPQLGVAKCHFRLEDGKKMKNKCAASCALKKSRTRMPYKRSLNRRHTFCMKLETPKYMRNQFLHIFLSPKLLMRNTH